MILPKLTIVGHDDIEDSVDLLDGPDAVVVSVKSIKSSPGKLNTVVESLVPLLGEVVSENENQIKSTRSG